MNAATDSAQGPARHPSIVQLTAYWDSIRPEPGLLPGKQHFDATAVPLLLANIYLLEAVGDPVRFRFRLVGENIMDAGGPGRPGKFVDEIPRTETGSSLHDQLHAVQSTGEPFYYSGPPTLRHHVHVTHLEGIMLPLAGDGRHVDNLLCLTVYRWRDGRAS